MLKKIHSKFQNLIAYLVYDKGWSWLEFIISLLCEIEMQWPLVFDNEFRHNSNSADILRISPPPEETETFAEREIPKCTLYCESCTFRSYSDTAIFFYGYQSCGYCYYLGKGDFSFIRPTSLLWDGCKECGRFEDIDLEEDNEQTRFII